MLMLDNIAFILDIIVQNMDICWMKLHAKHFINSQTEKLVSLKTLNCLFIYSKPFIIRENIVPESKTHLMTETFIVNNMDIFIKKSIVVI